MGWIRCVRCENIQCDFVARTFALIAPVQPILHRVSSTNEMVPNAPKHYKNAAKDEFRVQWGGSGALVAKNYNATSWHKIFALIAPVQYVLQQVSCSYETIPNAPIYDKTNRIIWLGSSGVDLVRSLLKIPTSLRGTNFCINCTSSPRFAPCFMQLRNDPKCTQTQ